MHSHIILAPERIRAILAPFGGKLSDPQISSFSKYLDMLIRWNRAISLTTVNDPEEIVERHFGESMFAASIVSLHGRLADVGSGAGFPGLPIRIVYPQIQALLLEPNAKKGAFLIELCAALNLTDVQIVKSRYEDLPPQPASLDIITARAVGNYKGMLRWARTVLRSSGCIILWLGEEDANALGKVGGWQWSLPVRIPGSRRRVILTGHV